MTLREIVAVRTQAPEVFLRTVEALNDAVAQQQRTVTASPPDPQRWGTSPRRLHPRKHAAPAGKLARAKGGAMTTRSENLTTAARWPS